jgi:hypothetical protein
MKIFCLRLVLFGLLGTILLSLFSPKALAKDSYGLTWTVSPLFKATPSAVVVDLSDNIYYAGYLASGSGQQMNPYYSLDPTHQTSDTKTATTGAIFLTKMKSDLTYNNTYIIEADAPKIVSGLPVSVSLTKMSTDSAQNVWLLGSFNGNVDFDPTAGMDYHSSGGKTWQFLTEIKANGSYNQTYLWSSEYLTVRDMIIDGNDNIIVAGTIANTTAGDIIVALDPLGGTDIQTLNAGDTMGFYTKLAVGAPYTYAYSRTLKNTLSQHLELDHIASTSAGNIFLYGVFAASTQMNFNVNNGGDNYKSSSGGSDDLYLSKYDQDGAYVTTYIIGGSGAESAQALGIDKSGNIYFSGGFNSTVNFNPINPTVSPDNKTATLADQRFLTKLNSGGTYGYTLVWISNSLSIYKIAFDSSYLIYLVGISAGTTNYDPIATSDSQLGFGGNDAFMTVLNPDKTYGYTYVWGGTGDEKALDGAFNSLNDFYIAGSTKSLSINFDPTGVTSTATTFAGGENGYVTELSSTPLPSPTPTPTPSPTPTPDLNVPKGNPPTFGEPVHSFTCTSPIPAAPKIFQIWATQTTATIYFVPSRDPENAYTISYGLYSSAEMYNTTFNYSDKSGAIPYKINALSANSPYYFKVRANNGCMPGSWSNTLSLKTAYATAGATIAFAPNDAASSNASIAGGSLGGSCSQYTVMPGDSFWKIAQNVLGAGNKYLQIWNANKIKFPSLNYSSVIRSGWTLSVGC